MVACMTPSQNQASQHSSLEERDLSLRGGVVDSCWLLGEGESALLKGVTPGRLALPGGRSHTHESMSSFNWNMSIIKKKEGMNLVSMEDKSKRS